jgi:hypothetical protein
VWIALFLSGKEGEQNIPGRESQRQLMQCVGLNELFGSMQRCCHSSAALENWVDLIGNVDEDCGAGGRFEGQLERLLVIGQRVLPCSG